ncbi:MAG: hypothetical protein P4L10_03670 [Acidobacteriaceae bacterium]|jgi:hypothetical protein|nr:hypothetical protein [Acidobacteriaceae bacterium]
MNNSDKRMQEFSCEDAIRMGAMAEPAISETDALDSLGNYAEYKEVSHYAE